jgi:membrane protease YdiL (CAAX protease family)
MSLHGVDTPSARPCRPWGFWASAGFGLLALVAWTLLQWTAMLLALRWLGVGPRASGAQIAGAATHGLTLAVATILSAPAALVVIAGAVRLRGCGLADYLALRMPSRLELLFGVGLLVVLLPLGDLASYLTGRDIVPAFVVEAYRTARATGILVMLALALVVAAPAMEEVLFRGFLFRGFSESRLGPAGVIVVTSVLWAAMHLQYETFYIVQIFLFGCVLGWLRWRSQSTMLTFVMHGLVNFTALLQAAFIAERAIGAG